MTRSLGETNARSVPDCGSAPKRQLDALPAVAERPLKVWNETATHGSVSTDSDPESALVFSSGRRQGTRQQTREARS